jgi:hypothetical protein
MQYTLPILSAIVLAIAAFGSQKKTIMIKSPDRQFIASIISVGTEEDKDYESRVEIRKSDGTLLYSKSYMSDDHEHGRGVLKAQWTPDAKFFVFSTVNSGGHQPWHFPTYYYSCLTNKIYEIDHFAGPVIRAEFQLKAPDIVIVVVQDPTRTGDTENGLLKSIRLHRLRKQ